MKTIGRKVIIEPDKFEDTKTESGIVMAQSDADKMKHTKGVVKAIGENVKEVEVGDHIMYSPLTFDEVEVDGKTLHVVEEDDVFLKLEE